MALMNLDPARNTVSCAKAAAGEGLVHEMAVVSREAERTRVSDGAATART